MLRAVMIAIHNRRLDRLRRLLGRAHHLLRRALLCRGGRLLAHFIRIRHLRLIVRLVRYIDLVLAVLLYEGGEVLDGAGAAVDNGVGFAAGGEELDGWEAGNFVGDVVGGGVDFGDGDF